MRSFTKRDILAFVWVLGAVASICAVALFWPYQGLTVFGFAEGSEQRSRGIGELLLGLGLGLVGILFGSAYRRLVELERGGATTLEITPFLKAIISSIDLWKGLCGAPILFCLLVRGSSGLDLTGFCAFAVENGFFCTVILSSMPPRKNPVDRGVNVQPGEDGAGGSQEPVGDHLGADPALVKLDRDSRSDQTESPGVGPT